MDLRCISLILILLFFTAVLVVSPDSATMSSTNFTSNSNLSSSIYNLTVLNETMRSSFSQSYTKAGAIEITFLVFLMIVIIFGNSMVCLAFSSVDRQLRTVTNYFVINLALSDILVGTFSMSFWLCIRTGK